MSIRANAGVLRTLAFSSTTTTYVAIGTAINHAASIVFMQNLTDADMIISLDGVNDNFYLVAHSAWTIDVCTNHDSSDVGLFIPNGTQFYVKQGTATAATLGSVTVSYIYDSSH